MVVGAVRVLSVGVLVVVVPVRVVVRAPLVPATAVVLLLFGFSRCCFRCFFLGRLLAGLFLLRLLA